MNKIRSQILRKLIHKPGLSFNKIWEKEIPSNQLAYHLKVLQEDNYVENKDGNYYLTHQGKKFSAYIDGISGKESKKPLICVVVVLVDQNKVLMQQRKKEPFYNYWGFAGGKIEFDQYILETAKQELEEEAGLKADLSLKGILCMKTYNNGQQSYNHHIFIVRGDNPRGKLIIKNREGINKWIEIDKIKSLQIFPDVQRDVEIAHGEGFTLFEMDKFMKDDKFIKSEIIRDEQI